MFNTAFNTKQKSPKRGPIVLYRIKFLRGFYETVKLSIIIF